MRKFILGAMLFVGSILGWGQSALQGNVFMATGTGTTVDLSTTAVMTHQIIWRPKGTVTTCQVQLDYSQDNVTWVSGGIVGTQTCTSNGQSSQLVFVAPFVRVNLTTFTGGGTLYVTYAGSYPQAINLVNSTTVAVSNFPATQPISGTVAISGTVPVSVPNPLPVSGSFSTPTTNPCANPAIVPNSAPINISTATTTQLVAGVGGQQIFVCGLTLAMSGTVAADTFKLVQGTGASCTSPSDMTGPMTSGILTAGATVIPAAPIALKPTATGASLCAVTTVGTLPSIAGVLSYVQQ